MAPDMSTMPCHGRLVANKLQKAAAELDSQRQIGEALLKKRIKEQDKKLVELENEHQEEHALRMYWEGVAAQQAATLRRVRGARARPGDDLY